MRPAGRIAAALAALACSATLVPAAAIATAAAPRVNITDLEDEVMCPICGTLLELSDSPQARREKEFIAKRIAAGESKSRIKRELVDEYGPDVLALPGSSGFDLSAYLVPAVGFALAAVALAVGVGRWRRRGGDREPRGPGAPGEEDAERLDADMARYDL